MAGLEPRVVALETQQKNSDKVLAQLAEGLERVKNRPTWAVSITQTTLVSLVVLLLSLLLKDKGRIVSSVSSSCSSATEWVTGLLGGFFFGGVM